MFVGMNLLYSPRESCSCHAGAKLLSSISCRASKLAVENVPGLTKSLIMPESSKSTYTVERIQRALIGTLISRIWTGWAWISSLRFVDLSGNCIGSEGVDLLADELPFWQQAH